MIGAVVDDNLERVSPSTASSRMKEQLRPLRRDTVRCDRGRRCDVERNVRGGLRGLCASWCHLYELEDCRSW
eukprot:4503899-Heterocapsa_arctica.AAC.1